VVDDVVSVGATVRRLQVRGAVEVADPERSQVGNDRRSVVEGEAGVQLHSVSGARPVDAAILPAPRSSTIQSELARSRWTGLPFTTNCGRWEAMNSDAESREVNQPAPSACSESLAEQIVRAAEQRSETPAPRLPSREAMLALFL
jgi:hypothetical protein